MADNIKIVGEILNTQQVSRYSADDINLLNSQTIKEDFGQQNDYIEYYVYDAGNNLLNSNYSYKDFKLPTTSYLDPVNGTLPIIEIDPVKDLQNLGYSSGEFIVQYNFFNNRISNPSAGLFLKEISADRTELRIASTVLTNQQIEDATIALINQSTSSAYFVDYLINFGDNTQVVAVNVALNKVDSGYEILFKLYQPLPENIQEKVTLWVVEEKTSPYIFDINLDKLIILAAGPQLRGPNFNIEIPDRNNVATSYQTYNNLVNSVQSISSASYQQLLSLITSQSIDINVDYSDPSNFVFFSSQEARIERFKDKILDIANYQSQIEAYTPYTSSRPNLISVINSATSSINDIIANFDGYEYYLYFQSGSTNWPKSNSSLPYSNKFYEKPFIQVIDNTSWTFNHGLNETASIVAVYSGSGVPLTNYTTSSTGNTVTINFLNSYEGYAILASSQSKAWYDAATGSAELYDDSNQNNLIYTLPSFIKDDGNNGPYLTFLNMVGHYFDNIWIYLQSVTDINLANNNLEQGVSKDLVYYVLQSLGTKLYNKYGDSNNVAFLIGNSGSANWDNNFTITGSYLNTIPRKDLLAESYKRIYHNLPLLLKTKGTTYGLQTLVSAFGITGSTLPVKEYGGYLKANTLNEYNTDKIRIVTNTITGSVLSPYVNLQVFPSASSEFRTNDLHYVDISFSPQDKIDIFASASISVTNPSWSIDEYIGDPRYQYSSSYFTLDIQKDIYYSPLSASKIDFTASVASGSIGATNYNDFTRLIQFYDNSMFKMLKDYVPARTSLSTGVTFTSPLLERNKWSYARPNTSSEIEVNDGSIETVGVGSEYTDLYTYLTGSKVAYYDGNITGSYINIYNTIESASVNPYLGDFTTWNQQHSVSESISINKFLHSDFNVLLNNISSSLTSSLRQKIEYIYGTTGSILTPVQLQDSYQYLKTHQLSRYNGVKVSSLLYNDYTSASINYSGDDSFGKTAAIDHNVRKIGLFTEIRSSTFLPKRNNVALKYLVDEFGNLTELNQRNSHWIEIQNTFIAGDTLDVSLFDNQKYGNQKIVDGTKPIFDSGYVYSPILYFGKCSGSGGDPKIYFENLLGSNSYALRAKNGTSPANISGSTPVNYPLIGGNVYKIFDTVSEGSSYYAVGTGTTFPTYSVQESGDHKASATFDLFVTMSTGGNVTWSFGFYDKNNNIIGTKQTEAINLTVSLSATQSYGNYAQYSCGTDMNKTVSSIGSYITTTNISIVGGGTIPSGTTLYAYSVFTGITDDGSGNCSFSGGGTFYSTAGPTLNATATATCYCSTIDEFSNPITGNYIYELVGTIYDIPNFTTNVSGKTKISFNKNISTIPSLAVGDKIIPKLVLEGSSTTNFTASLSEGSLLISSLAVATGYASTTCNYFNSASISSSIADTITFSSGVSNFHNNNYIFVPNPLTGSQNSLYSTYGDVDYEFKVKPQDIILAYLSDGTYVESRVKKVSTSGSLLQVQLSNDMSSLYQNNLISGSYQRFLVLSRREDETSTYLTFQKRDGKTSYGFIIPDNLAPDVLANIDTITKEVKQKLISDQSIIDNINGGTFG